MELEDLDWADGPVRMLDRQPAASVARCTIRWARCCCGQNCCVSGCDKRRMESLAVEQHTVERVARVHVVLWEQQISAALQVWELAGVLVDSAGLARASDPQHTSIAAGLSGRRWHRRWTEAHCGPARPSTGSRMGSRPLSLGVWTPRDRTDRAAGRALNAAVGSSQVPRRACERVGSGGRV